MSLFDEEPAVPARMRVSIVERLVAAVSFGLAALSGIVGGVMTINLFVELSREESAGIDAIVGVLTEINFAVHGILGLSIAIGIAALVICTVRMLSDRPRSSAPGVLYLAAGIPNLISPLIIAYAWSVVADVVSGRYAGDATDAGAWISQMCIAAIPAGIVSILILPVFAFVPFSARGGRKISSIVGLAIVVIAITAVAIAFTALADSLISDPKFTRQ